MPKVSVIIPTYNRPEFLKKALVSVLNQSYQDFEVIVVDDGTDKRADKIINEIGDRRIIYIQHEVSRGGGAARNTGIRSSLGQFIAFLDDDDEWLPNKLSTQMDVFENTLPEVGFCFCAVKNITNFGQDRNHVPEGVGDYYNLALSSFKKFLTVTLIIKKDVFDAVGLFDEAFPSHQESELMIRITKKFKGLGIDELLVLVNMTNDRQHIGGNLTKRIMGRELLLKKHEEEFKKRPTVWANHLFTLGILYRNNENYQNARLAFKKALKYHFRLLYLLHYFSMMSCGFIYRLVIKLRS